MNLKGIPFKKPVKLVILLMTSLLIAGASATIYYSMNMRPTVTITTAKVRFDQGTDWPGGSSSLSSDKTFVTLDINAYPNATLTYDEPLVINNTDGSAHQVRLSHVSITPNASASVSNFTFINFTLNGVDFDYTTSDDNWNAPDDMTYQNMPQNTEWAVKIETKAAAGATTTLTCTIVIAVDVQE